MTFVRPTRARFRLSRSVLYAMGHRRTSIEAAAASDADVVLFELEDAVPVDAKERARRNVVEALGDLDWSGKSVTVRINALDSPFTYLDVIALLEAPSASIIDSLFLPKAGVAADVYALDVLVTQVERTAGRTDRVGFDVMIESALGLTNITEIAAASDRIESLQFGAFDYANSARMLTSIVGGPHPHYVVPSTDGSAHWNDPFHYPIGRIVSAARAHGLRPIDGPYVANLADVDADREGFTASARRGRTLGCEGKQTLSPDQAAVANHVFSPAPEAVERAREVAEAAARADARGVIAVNGQYVDAAAVHAAQDTIAKAQAIVRRS
jgi:malyl-CoA/(S)-citramalyl-CoA lyase